MSDGNLPAIGSKPTLRDWLESFVPFKLPHVPLVQTAKNIDLAIARVVSASGSNITARIEGTTRIITAKAQATSKAVDAATKLVTAQIAGGATIADRAIEYAYADSLLRQTNRERIAAIACEDIENDPPQKDATAQIDDDWLNQFARYAENVSTEAIQSLWARILAGEIRQPGSIKIRTLRELSVISTDEASLIHEVLSMTFSDDFVFNESNITPLDKLMTCQDLGILSGAEGTLTKAPSFKIGQTRYFRCHNIAISVTADKDVVGSFTACPLTTFGRDMLRLATNFQANPEYVRRVAEHIVSKQIGKVSLLTLGKELPDGQYEIASKEDL